jgi:xanthine dehydrogenase YagR molybdenum-binding subunit
VASAQNPPGSNPPPTTTPPTPARGPTAAQPSPAGAQDQPSALVKKWVWPDKPAILGTSVKRLDGPEKVTGRAKYTFDVNRPGMLYGRIVRSPHPHARIVAIDFSDAMKAPGVKTTLSHKQPGAEVLYQGDPVAAIAADTEEHAVDAARRVKVEYEVLPHVATVERALAPDAPAVFQGGNTKQGQLQESGDLDAGFQQAVHTIEQTYATQVITHVCMESHACVAEWDGDRLTAWISTQAVHGSAQQFAQALGIPQTNVRVMTQYMGGGFGSKTQVGAEGLIAARLARAAGAPVKVALDRKEEHLDTGNRPSATARVKAGVAADGTLTAFDGESWGTGGAGAGANFPLPYIYQFPNRRRQHKDVYTNTGQQRPMRAPGHPQGCFITEILMEELADLVQMDPVAFRIMNCPPLAPNAMWRDYLAEGARLFGWDKRHPTKDSTRGAIKTGMGCAVHQWGGGGRGSQVRCEITSDGAVAVKCGTQDIGTGTRTIVAMVAAETLGLPVSAVTPMIGDTLYPFSGGSGGSTTAASVSPAVRLAAGQALDALCAKIAPALGVDPGVLVAANGRILSREDPSKGLAWMDACKLIGTEPITADAQWQNGLSSTGTSGVQFAEVEVDVETGIVRVKRVLAIQDCGLVVDKLTAESQVHGGIVGSLNFALFEDRILDRNTGQMVNPNMEWYLLAGPSDMPRIEIHLKNMPERGVIGIGEPPTVSTSAALANAVRNATGATLRSLPLTPHRILEALQQQGVGVTL